MSATRHAGKNEKQEGFFKTAGESGRTKLSLTKAHAYWERPDDGMNFSLEYLLDDEVHCLRNASLLSVFDKHAGHFDSILEVGCNVEGSPHTLWRAGCHSLSAIEISDLAAHVMWRFLPAVYRGPRSGQLRNSFTCDLRPIFPPVFRRVLGFNLASCGQFSMAIFIANSLGVILPSEECGLFRL